MISLDVRASDYMEGSAVGDAEVSVTLRIFGWRFGDIPDEPGSDPGALGPGAGFVALRVVGPRPGGIVGRRHVGAMARRAGTLVRVPVGYEDLPVEVRLTDSEGLATFQWSTSPGSPFDRARQRILARDSRPGTPLIESQLRVVGSADGVAVSPEPLTTSQETASLTQLLSFDFAQAIVGHTTQRTCLLWFCIPESPPSDASYYCELLPQARVPPRGVENVLARAPLNFDARQALTTTVELSGLDPGTGYRYRLVVERPGGVGVPHRRVLTTGSFVTAGTGQEEIRIAFASCHKPQLLERCVALADEPRDLTILMGDQIYEPHVQSGSGWLDAYVSRYRYYWRPREFREAVRRGPTYMILDDHEVADDWGSFFTQDTEGFEDQVTSALAAYRLFQDAHNPEAQRRWRGDKYHYHFYRGPAAFFVLDERSQRRRASGSAVLGAGQREDLLVWSQMEETRRADVIILVSSVPLAFLPVETLLTLVNMTPRLTAGGIGLVGGSLLFGPGAGLTLGLGGFLFGGGAGEAILEEAGDRKIEWRSERLVSPDLQDHWSASHNQADLDFVLKVLFDLGNDVIDRGAHPRLVFVLGGDTHITAAHTIQSRRPEHASRPTILQLMSSPLSRDSLGAKQYLDGLGFFTNEFNLVSSGDYRARLQSEWLDEPNFGTLFIQRRAGPRRVYVVNWTLEGRTQALSNGWVEDLDRL
jgi:hypothetical protein